MYRIVSDTELLAGQVGRESTSPRRKWSWSFTGLEVEVGERAL